MSLRTKALIAGQWSTAAHLTTNIIRFISNIALARMLFPEAFGFIAVSQSIIVGLVLISDFGVRAVIIRRVEQIDDQFLFSAWTFQIIRGIIVWLILLIVCITAYYAISERIFTNFGIFTEPDLYLYTAGMGLSVIINGFESSNVHNEIRNLKIKNISVIEIITCIFTVLTANLLAYFWFSAWPLVIASVSSSIVSVLLTHTIVPGPRMKINFNKEHFQEITSIGKWIAASSAATFVSGQSDKIALGLISSTSFIGIYYIAKSIIQAFESLSGKLVDTLLLSVLKEARSNEEKEITKKFYKFRLPIDAFCALSGAMLFTYGENIVQTLYDDRYEKAGYLLMILSISIVIYPFRLVGARFTLLGDTHIVAKNTMVEAISLVGCMFVGYRLYNLEGAIWGLAVHRVIPSITILATATQKGWVQWLTELRVIAFFGGGLIAAKIGIIVFRQLGFI